MTVRASHLTSWLRRFFRAWFALLALMVLGTLVAAWQEHTFLQDAVQVDGTVIDVGTRTEYHDEGGSYTVTDMRVRYDVDGTPHEMSASMNGEPNAAAGDSIAVMYHPDSPGRAKLAYSKWRAPAYAGAGLLALVLFGAPALVMRRSMLGAMRVVDDDGRERLVALGCTVSGPARVERISTGGAEAWFVFVEAYDPHVGEVRRFRSLPLLHDPAASLRGSATVFLDPDDPDNYWVQEGRVTLADTA